MYENFEEQRIMNQRGERSGVSSSNHIAELRLIGIVKVFIKLRVKDRFKFWEKKQILKQR